jgi:saccharopine dehydrogenase-like NADP-dependent oxidoreductase
VSGSKLVLVLGDGLVAGPLVRWLACREDVTITVASLVEEEARRLVGDHPRGTARGVNVADAAELARLFAGSDVVVSLVPAPLPPLVARLAVHARVHLVTTSYVSPEMRALDAEARAAGVALLNEVGLDPGLDHMEAMRLIGGIRAEGGTLRGFVSACGSLPAPEAADNPWRYKFAWSPRGALVAATQSARYLAGGDEVLVPGETLFEACRATAIDGVGPLELYPNRDSLHYVEVYGLHDVADMMRATLLYPGFCETMRAVNALGLLELTERDHPAGASWRDLTAARLAPGPGAIRERVAGALGLDPGHAVLERLAWAGLFEDTPLPARRRAPLDLLAERLAERMRYREGERDMVVQRHEFDWTDRHGRARRTVSSLVAYGEPGGESATARTVSLPAAVAVELLLDGDVALAGVVVPTSRELYEPILARLAAEAGIAFGDSSRSLEAGTG